MTREGCPGTMAQPLLLSPDLSDCACGSWGASRSRGGRHHGDTRSPPPPDHCPDEDSKPQVSFASLKKKKAKREKKFLQVEQSLCWIWEMLFLVTDKGNYLQSASSFSLISLLLCNSPRAASLSMSCRTD